MSTFQAVEFRDYNFTNRVEECSATSLEMAVRHFLHKHKMNDAYAFVGPSGRTIISNGRLWLVQSVA